MEDYRKMYKELDELYKRKDELFQKITDAEMNLNFATGTLFKTIQCWQRVTNKRHPNFALIKNADNAVMDDCRYDAETDSMVFSYADGRLAPYDENYCVIGTFSIPLYALETGDGLYCWYESKVNEWLDGDSDGMESRDSGKAERYAMYLELKKEFDGE